MKFKSYVSDNKKNSYILLYLMIGKKKMEKDNYWDNVYPRVQLKRNSFLSLNGLWTCQEHEIIVPF